LTKRIVIVDDDHTIIQILKAFIRQCTNGDGPYDIVTFETITEACDHITEHPVDLLFQDVHVQNDLDGLIAARIAKNFGVPVVIITSDICLSIVERVARGKYDKLILKPISIGEVKNSLSLCK
jgi:DNA-binding NtrC family response regulator